MSDHDNESKRDTPAEMLRTRTLPVEIPAEKLTAFAIDSIEYDSAEDLYRVQLAVPADSPSMGVVGALSIVTMKDPTELTPIHTAVDADALDTLFRVPNRGIDRWDPCVTFTLEDHEITIRATGAITLRPPRIAA